MKQIQVKIREHAELTGYIHESDKELKNIEAYPGILILPGGGFRICSSREAEPVAAAYFAEGYQAFVLRYTTVTSKPDAVIADPMEDVQEALSWIRENASELFLQEHQLAMLGFSGGAHLASASATHGPLRPNALLLGYPGILHSELRALECPDIIESVDEQTPPAFLFVGRRDTVTPPVHVLTFALELDKYGTDYELHIFQEGVHGMSLAKAWTSGGLKEQMNFSFAQWFDMSVAWLKHQFGEFTVYGLNDGRYGTYSIDTPLQTLFESAEAKQIAAEAFPMLEQICRENPLCLGSTLRMMAEYLPGAEERLEDVDRKLLELP